jgi:large subunit ribosomal protein L24
LREKSRVVVVEGVSIVTKPIKKSQQHPDGAIIKFEHPIHISNVMLKAKYESKHKHGVSK